MALISATLSNKAGKYEPIKVTAKYKEPRIVAKNWYQLNTNFSLKALIEVKGDSEVLARYNVIEFKLKGELVKYRIFNSRELSRFVSVLEVGV